MKSLTKIMILSLSLGIFAQDTYASGKVEKEDAGCCSCFSFLKCLRKTRQVLEPVAEVALDVAATAAGKPELHTVAQIMHTANGAIDATEVGLNIDFNASNLQDGISHLDLKKGAEAATHETLDVLQAAGQGGSQAASVLKKAAEIETKL